MNSLFYWIAMFVFVAVQVVLQVILSKADIKLIYGFIVPGVLVLLSILFAVKCFFYTDAASVLANAIYMIVFILLGLIDMVLFTVLRLLGSKTKK